MSDTGQHPSKRQGHKSGPLAVVSEERDDGTFEIRTTTLETEPVEPSSTKGSGAGSPQQGSGAAWIGLVVVLLLLGTGAYLLFVSPRSPDREPPLVTSEGEAEATEPSTESADSLNERIRRGEPVRVSGEETSPVLRRSLLRRSGVEGPAGRRIEAAPGLPGVGQRQPTLIRRPIPAARNDLVASPRSDQLGATPDEASELNLTPEEEGPGETRVLGPSYPAPNPNSPDAGVDTGQQGEAEAQDDQVALEGDDLVGSDELIEDDEPLEDDEAVDDEAVDDELYDEEGLEGDDFDEGILEDDEYYDEDDEYYDEDGEYYDEDDEYYDEDDEYYDEDEAF